MPLFPTIIPIVLCSGEFFAIANCRRVSLSIVFFSFHEFLIKSIYLLDIIDCAKCKQPLTESLNSKENELKPPLCNIFKVRFVPIKMNSRCVVCVGCVCVVNT